MVPTIHYLSPADIRTRREDLLARAHANLGELREKNARYMLDLDEQAILRELENLEYLASS
jgi:hypothetical protein